MGNNEHICLTSLIDKQYYKLWGEIKRHDYREFLLSGGRGSLKSSVISLAIGYLLTKDTEACAVIYRQHLNTVELSVYEQIKWAFERLGIIDSWEFTSSTYRARNKATGQMIVFKGLDKAEKTKSIKPPPGKHFKILWFEEADQFNGENALRMVKQSVFRGYNGNTWTFYSWNPPRLLSHWIYDYKNNSAGRKHFSCYLGVKRQEWLGRTFIEEARELERTNPSAYAHEYLGRGTSTEGLVFSNFRRKIHVIKSLNSGEKILRTILAIDPAVENDATAGVPVHITSQGRAVVGKVFYYSPKNPGCMPLAPSAQVELIVKWLKELKGTRWYFDLSKTTIFFDPAGASLRREMQYQTGLKTQVISKQPVLESVWQLQDLFENGTLYILEDYDYKCPLTGRRERLNPLIRELETLAWEGNKNGKIPEGQLQDTIDALRYAVHFFVNPQLLHQYKTAQASGYIIND